MWIRPDGTDGAPVDTGSYRRPGRALSEVSTLPPPVVAPPQNQRPVPAAELELPKGAPRAQSGADVARLQRESAASSKGVRVEQVGAEVVGRPSADITHETAAKEEKDTEKGPSIIVDMGLLADPSASVEVVPEEPEAPDATAFAPLSSTPAPAPRASTSRPPVEFEVDSGGDIKAVRPPRLWILGVIVVLMLLAAVFLFVWWRNDWRPVWDNPGVSWEIAIGERPRPVIEPKAPPAIEAAPSKGTLEVQGVELSLMRVGRERAAVITGKVANNTNRFQRAIGIEASVVEVRPDAEPLKLKTRVAPCCMLLDEKSTREIAKDPEHPHYSDKIDAVAQTRLAPGESRPFTIVLRDLGKLQKGQSLQAAATIKYSESE